MSWFQVIHWRLRCCEELPWYGQKQNGVQLCVLNGIYQAEYIKRTKGMSIKSHLAQIILSHCTPNRLGNEAPHVCRRTVTVVNGWHFYKLGRVNIPKAYPDLAMLIFALLGSAGVWGCLCKGCLQPAQCSPLLKQKVNALARLADFNTLQCIHALNIEDNNSDDQHHDNMFYAKHSKGQVRDRSKWWLKFSTLQLDAPYRSMYRFSWKNSLKLKLSPKLSPCEIFVNLEGKIRKLASLKDPVNSVFWVKYIYLYIWLVSEYY